MILPQSSIDKVRKHFGLSKEEARELNEQGSIEFGTISMLSIFPVLRSRQNPNMPSLQYNDDVMEVKLTYVGTNRMSYGAPPRQNRDVESIVVLSKQGEAGGGVDTQRVIPPRLEQFGHDWAYTKTRPMKGDPT